MPTDPLLRLAELLGALAEKIVGLEVRVIEAIGRLETRLINGGKRAGKAEKDAALALSKLATTEAVEALRAEQEARHAAVMDAFARVDARLAHAEARPAPLPPTTWADVFKTHPNLTGALVALLVAIAAYLGSLAPRRVDEPVTPPTAVLPGAGSRLMNDRRLADGSEG